jgi:TIR domain/Sel1 repeat
VAHDVFISYSSKDKPAADATCAILESKGIRCWIAPRDIIPGADWGESIINALNQSRAFVLVFSSHANSSPQIKREVERAVNHGLPVIPLRIEDVAPTKSLEYFISTPHWLDAFSPPLERHLNYLVDVLSHILENKELPPKLAQPVAAVGKDVKAGAAFAGGRAAFMQQPGSRWAMIFGVAVIVVAGVSYGVVTLPRQPASVAGTPTAVSPAQPVPAAAAKSGASDPLGLDLITDCDRLAAFPGDPQGPQGVTGISTDQIDIVPALTACSAAMRQYPNVVRFTFQAGRIAVAQKDYMQARQLFEKAAAAGYKGALNGLGSLYYYGKGVVQDYAAARTWYEKAAAAGNSAAMFSLGLLNQNGNGIAQDYAAARTWYEKAAAAGNASAMNGLGNIYYNGNGVAQDYAAARTWYEKAAAAGNAIAMNNLGNTYYNGNGVAKDYDRARIWYVKAVAAGYTSASAIIQQIDASKQK